jgi:hypothetical protein
LPIPAPSLSGKRPQCEQAEKDHEGDNRGTMAVERAHRLTIEAERPLGCSRVSLRQLPKYAVLGRGACRPMAPAAGPRTLRFRGLELHPGYETDRRRGDDLKV